MSYQRRFLAIGLPSPSQNEIAQFISEINYENKYLRWTSPTNLHLNLSFLGNISDNHLSTLTRSLPHFIKTPVFSLSPGFIDYFYKRHGDSIVYLSVRGDLDQLSKLFNNVYSCLQETLNLTSTDRFYPHITLGRLTSKIDQIAKKNILSQITNHAPPSFSSFTVSTITLFQSDLLRPPSTKYQVLSVIPLLSPNRGLS